MVEEDRTLQRGVKFRIFLCTYVVKKHPIMDQLTPAEALQQLAASGKISTDVFRYGSLVVEIYRPHKVDLQQPHTRDEIYVVISGKGQFECDGALTDFAPGDFLFVPAFAPHRFVDFSEDFATWVFFYGPEGGE